MITSSVHQAIIAPIRGKITEIQYCSCSYFLYAQSSDQTHNIYGKLERKCLFPIRSRQRQVWRKTSILLSHYLYKGYAEEHSKGWRRMVHLLGFKFPQGAGLSKSSSRLSLPLKHHRKWRFLRQDRDCPWALHSAFDYLSIFSAKPAMSHLSCSKLSSAGSFAASEPFLDHKFLAAMSGK